MTYLTAAADESQEVRSLAGPAPTPSKLHHRLRAGVLLVGLLSLAAAFWIAVISLVA